MKTLYWSSTAIVSAFLLLSSYTYLFSSKTIEGIKDLGFPDFFRIQLAVLKLLAVLILLIPQVPIQIKEWAYAGVGLFLITAIVAHSAHNDPIIISLINLLMIVVLIVSNIYLQKLTV